MRSRKRPSRFALQLPVKYRTAGERRWHAGVTVAVSASGAVIDGDVPRRRGEPIVVVISLPAARGCLTARGRILLTPSRLARRGHSSFSIAVPRYRLESRSGAVRRLDALLQGC